jgi:osmotically inducible lipoprotein OsmB
MRRNIFSLFVISVVLAALCVGCETTPVQQGALMGGALGAGAGAIIGNQVHHQGGSGALIGAAAGALTGAIVGDQVEKSRERAAAAPPPPPPQTVVVQQPPPQTVIVQQPPPSQTVIVQPAPTPTVIGHYENRIVRSPSGETFEQRVWVPGR